MKRSLGTGLALAVLFVGTTALASGHSGGHSSSGYHMVSGYTRSNGTYVAPHYQTNPNATRNDNWSTRGNVNPFTGTLGTKPGDGGYYVPSPSSSYGAPRYSAPVTGAPNPALLDDSFPSRPK